MSDYERAVKQFKMECKEAKRNESKTFVLTMGKKRRKKHLFNQTNTKLNRLFHKKMMKQTDDEMLKKKYPGLSEVVLPVKFRTPFKSSLNDEELELMNWFQGEDDDYDTISLPDTVKAEFARFEPNIHRLTQQHDVGNITDEEYIAGRQALMANLEESRYYRERGAGTELVFEPRPPDTERPASTTERPMGRIISDPIGEFTYDVPEGPIY